MEIRARYTLMGAFVLTVAGAVFAFVYWLNNAGGLGKRDAYQIRYENSVTGLLEGSAVLFNGVRVGEVTALRLDELSPRHILVTISVDSSTPVRADTKAGIDFQGLSGSPVVSLTGGAADAVKLEAGAGVLLADADSTKNLTQSARDVLRQIDTVVSENSEPLHNLIVNIDNFSGALARNSGKVDGILAGLEKFTGGGAGAAAKIIDLPAAKSFAGLERIPGGQLIVYEPAALSLFDSAKVLVKGPVDAAIAVEPLQWPDVLPKVMHARILQSFESAGYLQTAGQAPEGATPDYYLRIDIRKFQIDGEPQRHAEVEYGAKILNAAGQIIGSRVFESRKPLQGRDAPSVEGALSSAFSESLSQLVIWSCTTIADTGAAAPKSEPSDLKSEKKSPPRMGQF